MRYTLKIARFMLEELLYNGHIQSLGAASIVYISFIFLNLIPQINILFLTYLVFQTIYIFDRYRDIKKDYLTNRVRTSHLKIYINKIPILLAIYLFFIFLIFIPIFYINLQLIFYYLFILIAGLLYPIYFKKLTRKIFAFKNFYVASVFSILPLAVIIFYKNIYTINYNLFMLIMFIFFETIIMQIILDIKDFKNDRLNKLLTVPAIFKIRNTIKILYTITIFVPLLVIFWFFLVSNDNTILILLLTSLITAIFNFYILHNIILNKKNFYILASSKHILWIVIVIVARIIL